jgi:hypothetical protein
MSISSIHGVLGTGGWRDADQHQVVVFDAADLANGSGPGSVRSRRVCICCTTGRCVVLALYSLTQACSSGSTTSSGPAIRSSCCCLMPRPTAPRALPALRERPSPCKDSCQQQSIIVSTGRSRFCPAMPSSSRTSDGSRPSKSTGKHGTRMSNESRARLKPEKLRPSVPRDDRLLPQDRRCKLGSRAEAREDRVLPLKLHGIRAWPGGTGRQPQQARCALPESERLR